MTQRDFRAELQAARDADDCASHAQIWEEMRLADGQADEDALAEELARCQARDAFEGLIAAIENQKLRSRVEDSAYVNAFGNRDEYPNDLARWQAAFGTAQLIMEDPKDFYGDDWKEFRHEAL
jgi:hypothetical protein